MRSGERIKAQIGQVDVEQLRFCADQIGAIRNLIYCDNPSVNAMLASFERQFAKQAVSFQITIEASLLSGIDGFDMNTLLSNLLKNALEAAESAAKPGGLFNDHPTKTDVIYPLCEFLRSAAAEKEADSGQWNEDHHADR